VRKVRLWGSGILFGIINRGLWMFLGERKVPGKKRSWKKMEVCKKLFEVKFFDISTLPARPPPPAARLLRLPKKRE
jgi:hypothetical protein